MIPGTVDQLTSSMMLLCFPQTLLNTPENPWFGIEFLVLGGPFDDAKIHGKIHEDLDDGLIESTACPICIFLLAHLYIQWPFQEPKLEVPNIYKA